MSRLLLSAFLSALLTTAVACSDDSGSTPDASAQKDVGADAGSSKDRGLADISLPDSAPADSGFVCDPPAKAGEFWALEAKDLETISMCRYRGQVILLVNIAAKCGYTPQLGTLATLHKTYEGQGFTVLGFYSNQFLQAGSPSEQQSCETSYGVTFPTFEDVAVNPPNEHPVFTWLKSQAGGSGDIAWNFEKFLIGRDGAFIKRWKTGTNPDDADIVAEIGKALKATP